MPEESLAGKYGGMIILDPCVQMDVGPISVMPTARRFCEHPWESWLSKDIMPTCEQLSGPVCDMSALPPYPWRVPVAAITDAGDSMQVRGKRR